MTKDIAVVLDGRSDVVKLAGVIAHLGNRARIVHTGRNEEGGCLAQVLDEFGLGAPDAILDGIDAGDRATRVASAIHVFAAYFTDHRPAAVIVQGSTDAISACAQAANYADIPLIRVGAGVRSYDRAAPEEVNRLLIDALADVHCAATRHNQANLAAEGIDPLRISMTGNAAVESTIASLERGDGLTAKHFPEQSIPENYVLASLEHTENVGTRGTLRRALAGLVGITAPVIFAPSARARNAVDEFGLVSYLDALTVVDGLDHAEFLDLALGASLVITDSGSVLEECTVLKKPSLSIRRSTEHPEAIDAGFAQLITPGRNIASVANVCLADARRAAVLECTPSPYGDGSASLQIALIAGRVADGASPADAISGLGTAFE